MPPKPDIDIAPLAERFKFWPHPATDYIDMDLVIHEIDQPLRAQVLAAKFESVAAVHRAMADGAAKVAGILSRGAKVG